MGSEIQNPPYIPNTGPRQAEFLHVRLGYLWGIGGLLGMARLKKIVADCEVALVLKPFG